VKYRNEKGMEKKAQHRPITRVKYLKNSLWVNTKSMKEVEECVIMSGYYVHPVLTKQGSRYVMIQYLKISHYFVQSVNMKQ